MRQYNTFVLTLLVALFTLALKWVPDDLRIAGFSLRKMDILADIRRTSDTTKVIPETTDEGTAFSDDLNDMPLDSLSALPVLSDTFAAPTPPARPLPSVDSAFFGNVIEDYTPQQQGLSHFFRAIDSIPTHGRTVRVAFYGDSFVEGDILLGDLRDTLQSLWGGAGVGFVPVTSEVARFKRTLKHEYKGWTPHSIVKKDGNTYPYGINGFVYVPSPDAKMHYEGMDYFKNTRSWGSFRLFYTAQTPTSMIWQKGGSEPKEIQLPAGEIQQWKWGLGKPDIRAFAVRFPAPTPGFLVYGASLESGPGFYLDNFSLRGNSGGPLGRLKPEVVRRFNAWQRYDLIVIQVGLNAVTNDLTNVRWYEAELDRTFKHLRLCFPVQPILIVSVGDRADKVGTEIATMRGVPAITAMQRTLARKHGFLFFDLFHAMGGPGTMIRFAHQHPRLANLDYTHLTHDGGRVMGHLFANMLLKEKRTSK
jgi:lysophospholipase L1-like esterase